MIKLKQSRGERLFSESDSGARFQLNIIPLLVGAAVSSAVGGAAGSGVVGAVASAAAGSAASSLLSGMFGSEDEVEESYGQISAEQAALAKQMNERGDYMWTKGVDYSGRLDGRTEEMLSRLEPIASRQVELGKAASQQPEILNRIGHELSATGGKMAGYGQEAIDRHRGTYQPIEGDWIEDYESYASPERMAAEEGRAAGDVNQAYDAQRENALRQLEGYGIDPGQARYGALDLNIRLAQAAEQARAQTQARRDTEATARGMRSDILDYGRSYPTWGMEATNSGVAAKQAAAQVGQGSAETAGIVSDIYGQSADTSLAGLTAMQNTGRVKAELMGAPTKWGNAETAALGGQSNTTSQMYDDSGLRQGQFDTVGGMVGDSVGNWAGQAWGKATGGGGGSSAANIPGPYPGQTVGPGGQPIQKKALGGEIRGPGGPYSDQVPVAASDGEYMIPYEAVHRKGTEFFDKLVDKIRRDLQAIPTGG